MTRSTPRAFGLIGVACLSAFAASPASALNIVLAPDASFTKSANGAAALLGFQKAANYWNKTITNDVTLNFDVSFAPLAENVLGQTGSNQVYAKISDVYRQLRATGNSALDATAGANLKALSAKGGLAYRTPAVAKDGSLDITSGSVLDNNDSFNNRYLSANTTVAKALGIGYSAGESDFGSLTDARITFSSTFAFDYDPSDGITAGQFDYVGIAIHEMGHALGFVSGADSYDALGGKGPAVGAYKPAYYDGEAWLTVLDLFRYGANASNPDGSYDLQLDPGREAFFSIDGRAPFLENRPDLGENSYFATGKFNGDMQQASHWKDEKSDRRLPNGCVLGSRQVGIMDPTAVNCANLTVTANDLAAFDAIGWNINMDVLNNRGFTINTKAIWSIPGLAALALPEPVTWAQMILGFGLVGLGLRRRRLPIVLA